MVVPVKQHIWPSIEFLSFSETDNFYVLDGRPAAPIGQVVQDLYD